MRPEPGVLVHMFVPNDFTVEFVAIAQDHERDRFPSGR
jgi:hypothetical protein